MRLCLRGFFYEPPTALQTVFRLSDYLAMVYPNTSMPFNQNMPSGPYAVPGLIPSWNMYRPGNPHMLSTTSNVSEEEPTKDYKPYLRIGQRAAPFATVIGRLALTNRKRKYQVTVGEIARRASLPENLQTTMLSGILKNRKSRDNTENFHAKLKDSNITVAFEKGRNGLNHAFTSLTEGEAAEMAREFHLLLQDHGGVSDISNFLHMAEMARGGTNIPELSVVRKWLTKIIGIYPEGAQPDNIAPENNCGRAINHLNLITHGFSHTAIPTILRFALSIVGKTVLLQEHFHQAANGNGICSPAESSEYSSINSNADPVDYPCVPNRPTTYDENQLPYQPFSSQVQAEVMPRDFYTMNQWSQE